MPIHHQAIDYIDYRVCYGNIDWNEDGNVRPAIYVLMRYGNDITYRREAHILTTSNHPHELTDLEKVMVAMQTLQARHRLY